MSEIKNLLSLVVEACEERKAEEIVILDMQELSPIADYFVICNGNNERQVQAIARSVKEAVEENGKEIKRMEGLEQARWTLIDLNDIIVHVFHKDERSYYNLERLWGDAEIVHLGE